MSSRVARIGHMTKKRSLIKFIRAFHFDKLNDNMSGRTRKIVDDSEIRIFMSFLIDGHIEV